MTFLNLFILFPTRNYVEEEEKQSFHLLSGGIVTNLFVCIFYDLILCFTYRH